MLAAVSLGLSSFAAAIGLGVTGIDARTRLEVGVSFGIFETAMPILGLALGRGLARAPRHAAHWTGTALLIATGAYAVIAVGFALGSYHVTFALAAVIIGAVSVAVSLAGLELGHRIGGRTGKHGEVADGVELIAAGDAIGSGIL